MPKKQSPWIQFVMKVKAENPTMDFKNVLKLAGKLKKQGKDADEVVASKTKKANKKVKKYMKPTGKTGKRKPKGKSGKRKSRGKNGKRNTRKN